MPVTESVYLAFNRGLISPLGLARADIKRTSISAETMENWVPRVLGSMSLRAGLGYIGATASNNAARFIPFVFSTNDKALIEFTDVKMRVWISDVALTRPSVSSAVTNGNFDADVANWTDNDEAGGTSVWVTGGYMGLTGNGTAAAIRDQTVTVAAGDQGIEHALRIVIARGPVILRVGTGTSDDSYINETELDTGTHSLAFTPNGNFNIRFLSRLKRQVLVDSCNVESSGVVEITSPYEASDLDDIRFDQSGDIIFIAASDKQQRKVERRTTRSWSIVNYETLDGPFRVENVGPITITPSGLSGNITLIASKDLFRSTLVGALFRLTSQGQTVTASVTAQNTFTNTILVTGVDSRRVFSLTITGLTATGSTVTLQRSFDDPGTWEDITPAYTADTGPVSFDDTLDNQITYYRIGVKTGNYVGGTINLTLSYPLGSINGVVRLTGYTSSTSVSAEVIADLGDTEATDQWAEGAWSDYRGWPTSVGFHDGRLGWSGRNGVWLSVSDSYFSFDEFIEGDSGPIARTIGSGPVDRVNFMLSLQRLMLGAEGAEFSCKASSLDEPLTPTGFSIKSASSQGSANVMPVKIDSRGLFVQRGGARLYELSFQDSEAYDYGSTEVTAVAENVLKPYVVRMAAQRQPDTRVHCVLSDGTVGLMVYDKVEQVTCWIKVTSTGASGAVEDVVVLPGDTGESEDQVYYIVRRTINGSTVRYLERWALEEDCIGAALSLQADSYVTYTGAAATVIPVAHLEGEEVIVWANGVDVGTDESTGSTWTFLYTVSGGQITLANAATNVVVGLPYRARWKSGKTHNIAQSNQMAHMKDIISMAVIAQNFHPQGLFLGQDFDHLVPMPKVEKGAVISQTAMRTHYDEELIPVDGTWDTDTRLCLEARAPRPVTALALVANVEAV